MATTFKKFATVLVLAALTLVCLARTARADDCCCCDGTEIAGKTWTEGNFIEVGLRWDQLYSLYSLPNRFSRLGGSSSYLKGAYGWGTNKGEGFSAITLRTGFLLGGLRTSGTLDDGPEVDNRTGFAAPGFMLGQYLGKRLVLTEEASLFVSEAGPGAQIDVSASILIFNWFAIEFGVPAGFYRTGIALDDGKHVNMFALGFGLGLIFEPWGDYQLK